MRKNVNKLATLVMTGMLAASMSFSAFADDEVETAAASSVKELTIGKKLTTDKKTYAPETEFMLTVEADDRKKEDASSVQFKKVVNGELKALEGEKYSVTKGTAGQAEKITVTGAKFAPFTDEKDEEGNVTATKIEPNSEGEYTSEFKVSIPQDIFDATGVYSFKVTETDSKYTGIKYDDTTYYMYVSVINEQNEDGSYVYVTDPVTNKKKAVLKIDKNVIIAKADGTKITEITNDFGKSYDTTHDLTVTNKVTGNAGNQEKKFAVNIAVKPKKNLTKGVAASEEQYFAITDLNGKELADPINSNNGRQIQLSSGESFVIHGITEDYDVYIAEPEARKDGYKSTYEITDNGTGDKAQNTTKALDIVNDYQDATPFNVVSDGAKYTITNNRENVTPTGVAMDIAPYALMVALAGGAAATFLRKRESFED
ncbi:DUF7601 domain-containing protein [Oribacterium sp. WCC10]|uniref:DUF7601 domain-containing protein n=1 Tax=Oribacterium sp. WCC10 TaxID=1855343 RepID=UPI0008EE4ECC|nr:hypothetical protein [Oribacterium sp. WCC10]SFG07990.1 hypothetical protein SAMN05216356_101140 [Oribacterium sp. WCC10]